MGVFIGKRIVPQIWIAPRGLITVLLFYAIPANYQTDLFNPGILLFIIIATSLVMTIGLISFRLGQEDEEDQTLTPKKFLAPYLHQLLTPNIAG